MTQNTLKTGSSGCIHMQAEISVITCHHKGDLIYGFIDSIKQSLGVSYEIIVITSDDNLARRGIAGCLVFNGPQMPAEKRNMGARLAKGRFLAFFDDDVTVDRRCLYEYQKAFDRLEKCGMVYGKLWNMEHKNRFDEAGGYLTSTGFLWSRAQQNDVDNGQYDIDAQILAGKSASCMILKDLFFRVDGFDESFGILGEETDLAWRVWLIGRKVWFVPTATGYHAFNTVFKPAKDYYSSERVHFNGCRNYITMLIKNLETHNLWKILPLHCLIWFSAGFAMLITGKLRQGWNIWRGLWYVLRNLREILDKRGRIQITRRVDDKALWPHIYRQTSTSYNTQRFWRYVSSGVHG